MMPARRVPVARRMVMAVLMTTCGIVMAVLMTTCGMVMAVVMTLMDVRLRHDLAIWNRFRRLDTGLGGSMVAR